MGEDLLYNHQQGRYCLISDSSTVRSPSTVTVGCELTWSPPHTSRLHEVKLLISHNGVEISQQNSSKYIIRRVLHTPRGNCLISVDIFDFTESDVGNYTCGARFGSAGRNRPPVLQTTVAVVINGSSTPCVPLLDHRVVQTPPVSLSKVGANAEVYLSIGISVSPNTPPTIPPSPTHSSMGTSLVQVWK